MLMKKTFALSIAAATLAFAQPAAAQEVQAPCVAGPFMVFFNTDSDQLTPQGKAILDNAASAYRTCGQAQVMIAGHTDRKGTDQYNVGLSQRIAMAVRTYLVSRGIPDGVITTEAFGESRPLVDTPDGVSEPQNRRAEITFGPGSGW
jgi:OOP family OmpA-OmpF porin